MRRLFTIGFLLLVTTAFSLPAVAQGKGGGDARAEKAKGKDKKEKKGKKDKKGKKEAHGKPDDAGKHDGKGKPDSAGKSGEKGKPDDKGKADSDEKGKGKDGEATTQPSGDNSKQVADETRKHQKRLAKIQRLADIGAKKKNTKLVDKSKMLVEKENRRHERAMKRLAEARKADGADAEEHGKKDEHGKDKDGKAAKKQEKK